MLLLLTPAHTRAGRLRSRRHRRRPLARILRGRAHSGAHASAPQRLQAGAKKVLEISLVRRGARRGCHVLAYQDSGRQTVYTAPAPAPAGQCAWQTFDMY